MSFPIRVSQVCAPNLHGVRYHTDIRELAEYDRNWLYAEPIKHFYVVWRRARWDPRHAIGLATTPSQPGYEWRIKRSRLNE